MKKNSECKRYKLVSESDKKGNGITEELELPHAEVNKSWLPNHFKLKILTSYNEAECRN